jgi:hypothetical protein
LKSGFLDADHVMPLSLVERQACYYVFSEPATICQNMFLATEAIGLGGWKHCGFLSLEILERMGFRIARSTGALPNNPVGIDGVFEASSPPYHATMDAAVEAALVSYSRNDAPTVVPHRMSEAEHQAGAMRRLSEEGLTCTKAICNYIFETFGRFPGGTDAMQLMWAFQAHHIDTDYYDRFFGPGAYRPTHAEHMAKWHQ